MFLNTDNSIVVAYEGFIKTLMSVGTIQIRGILEILKHAPQIKVVASSPNKNSRQHTFQMRI